MPGKKDKERSVWGRGLFSPPRESQLEQLESALRRRELSLPEDARALRCYIQRAQISQAECARRLGRSQAAVANRLRLLKLPEDVLDALAAEGLSERHGRALLRLSKSDRQRSVLQVFLHTKMTVAEAEAYVDALTASAKSPPPPREGSAPAIDRLWRELEQLQSALPELSMELRDEGRSVLLLIRLPVLR